MMETARLALCQIKLPDRHLRKKVSESVGNVYHVILVFPVFKSEHTFAMGAVMSTLNDKRRISKLGIVLGTALVVAGTGCQTINPYTGETEVSKTTKGAGIGAVGGAVGWCWGSLRASRSRSRASSP